MNAGNIKLDDKGLKKLIKFFGGNIPIVRVGVLGQKDKRSSAGKGNAEIGYTHEFGTLTSEIKIPKRSFIIMPLKTRLGKEIKKSPSFNPKAVEKAVETGKADILMKKIGITAEGVIQKAFATRGFGQWPKNAPATIRAKGSDSPLIDTAQLRKSITSELVKGKK